jgi:hypothetical protein
MGSKIFEKRVDNCIKVAYKRIDGDNYMRNS